jgi:CDP-6-deoxy-D-xylo-4-hexulose-3-dehydrase
MKNTVTWRDKFNMIKFIAGTDRFTNGAKVRAFEEEWDDWLGSKHSLFVSSGSTANTLLVSAIKEKYGLKDGAKVLVPACTWVTNVGPIIQCGLQPIFCDINLNDYSFDTDHMKIISTKHHDIAAIFVTHLLGFSADIDQYSDIFPLALILEDICESHGCTDKHGHKRGANSLGATFSFYFGHHMTTIEGGMVSTRNEDLHDLMRIKRSHGLARELPPVKFHDAKQSWPNVDPRFMFMTDAYNFRNTEINAVLGSSQLTRLDHAIAVRKRNYQKFLKILSKYDYMFHMPSHADTNSNYAFPLIAKDKKVADKLKVELENMGIETRPIVSGNLLLQPFLQAYSMEPNSHNNIQVVHENGVYIGNNHLVTNSDIELLVEVLKNVVG